jgi:hypothetical protein
MTADLTKTVQCPYCEGEGGTMGYEDWSECPECNETGAMTIAAVHDLNSWHGSFTERGPDKTLYAKLKAEPVPDWIMQLPAATPREIDNAD